MGDGDEAVAAALSPLSASLEERGETMHERTLGAGGKRAP
jgi:hypothetical protein